MIPAQNIVAWGNVIPWSDPRQVEQDLIISRAIVAIFSDPFLRKELRFRGGTALNKLHFPEPLRYSEDIDLVRTTAGPIRPLLDALRDVLEPWLGHAAFDQSPIAPKLRFRVPAEDGSDVPIRLKVEVNTREIESFDPPVDIPFRVENPWFTGDANIVTYSREEILSTKLRALLQRDKRRDLFDLDHGLESFNGLDAARTTAHFGRYIDLSGRAITRAQAHERMFGKLARANFHTDMRPLLPAARAELLTPESAKASFIRVFDSFIERIPGEPWARTDEMRKRFEM